MRYSRFANKTPHWLAKVQSRWSQCRHKADSRAATIRRLADENADLRRRLEEAEHGSRSPDDRGPCALCGAAWSAHLGEAGVCPSGTVPASSVYVPTLRILKEAAERWEVKP